MLSPLQAIVCVQIEAELVNIRKIENCCLLRWEAMIRFLLYRTAKYILYE